MTEIISFAVARQKRKKGRGFEDFKQEFLDMITQHLPDTPIDRDAWKRMRHDTPLLEALDGDVRTLSKVRSCAVARLCCREHALRRTRMLEMTLGDFFRALPDKT